MGVVRDREGMINKINEASFAMDEARLFLDTHNDCEEAISYYQNMCAVRARLIEDYTEQYGPLNSYDCFCGDSFKWVDFPWPWEGECK